MESSISFSSRAVMGAPSPEIVIIMVRVRSSAEELVIFTVFTSSSAILSILNCFDCESCSHFILNGSDDPVDYPPAGQVAMIMRKDVRRPSLEQTVVKNTYNDLF